MLVFNVCPTLNLGHSLIFDRKRTSLVNIIFFFESLDPEARHSLIFELDRKRTSLANIVFFFESLDPEARHDYEWNAVSSCHVH